MSDDFDTTAEMVDQEPPFWIKHGNARSALCVKGPLLCKKKKNNALRVDKIKPLLDLEEQDGLSLETLAAKLNEKCKTYEQAVAMYNQGLKIKSFKRKRVVVDVSSDIEEDSVKKDDEDDDAAVVAAPQPRYSIFDQIKKVALECTESSTANLTKLSDENRDLKNRLYAKHQHEVASERQAKVGMEAEIERLRTEAASERQAKVGMEAEIERRATPAELAADKNKMEGFCKTVPLLKQRLARANVAMNEGNYDRAREQIEMVTELFSICDAYSSAF